MGKTYEALNDHQRTFIADQHMFFVATAPQSPEGHVNVSPKGYDSFVILDDRKVAYVDIGGSGIETVAHIKENGRLTIMFCAVNGPPKILRLYGRGRVLERGDDGFDDLLARFAKVPFVRNIVVLDITRVADSCGYGVPLYDYVGMRDQMERFLGKKTDDELRASQLRGNMESIDGLPGLSKPSI